MPNHSPIHPHNPCRYCVPAKIWELLRRNELFGNAVEDCLKSFALSQNVETEEEIKQRDFILQTLNEMECRTPIYTTALRLMIPEVIYELLKNVWELEIAARLCIMGNVTIPPNILKRSREELNKLQPDEFAMARRMPEISSQLMAQIPRMKGVSELILYQNKNFDGTGYPANDVKMDDIPLGGRLLRVLIDMFTAELNGTQRLSALETMESQGGCCKGLAPRHGSYK